MRILHLAYRDTSGVPGRWANAHKAAGHEARLLVEMPHPFVYGTRGKIMRWTPGTQSADERADRISGDLEWADAVMAYDHPFYLDTAVASGKPVLFRTLGQSAREHADTILELLRAPNVVRATVGLPDLAVKLGLELVGAPYPLLDPAEPKGLVLCHAPSDRVAKGTAAILRAAESSCWKVDLVEGRQNFVVLKRKRHAAVVVDSFEPNGYGVNAIEAMAMGLPAVAGGTDVVRQMWGRAGSPVVLVESEEHLRYVLVMLRDDPELRVSLGARGLKWVEMFHSGAARALEDTAAFEHARVLAA